MNNKPAPLVDEHLESIQDMQEAATDDFFYTRLKARMMQEQPVWGFSVKPVWAIASLLLLLTVNSFILTRHLKPKAGKPPAAGLQSFAESYDQTISSY